MCLLIKNAQKHVILTVYTFLAMGKLTLQGKLNVSASNQLFFCLLFFIHFFIRMKFLTIFFFKLRLFSTCIGT